MFDAIAPDGRYFGEDDDAADNRRNARRWLGLAVCALLVCGTASVVVVTHDTPVEPVVLLGP